MLSSYLDALLKLSKTTYPQKMFQSDCIALSIHKTAFGSDISIEKLHLHMILHYKTSNFYI